jgi:hypothetical protein
VSESLLRCRKHWDGIESALLLRRCTSARSGAHPPSDEVAEGWCCEHRPPGLDRQPCGEGGDLMPDPRQLDPDRIRVVFDQGGVVELDGGTLVLDGEESARSRRVWCCG